MVRLLQNFAHKLARTSEVPFGAEKKINLIFNLFFRKIKKKYNGASVYLHFSASALTYGGQIGVVQRKTLTQQYDELTGKKLTLLGHRECVCRKIAWSSIRAACCQRRPWQWCGRRTWSSWDDLSWSATTGWWYTSLGHRATYRTKHTSGWRSRVILLCTTHAANHQRPGPPLLKHITYYFYRRILTAVPQSDCRRPVGRPHSSWMATLKNDLSLHNLTFEDAIETWISRYGDYWQQAELRSTHWWCMLNNDDDDDYNKTTRKKWAVCYFVVPVTKCETVLFP